MIDGALPYLRCPLCRRPFDRDERVLRCGSGHSFDLARQGYANLTTGTTRYAGDTAEMVADREVFLAAGHYDFIADALAEHLGTEQMILDAGTGTGHYLAHVLGRAEAATGLGVDVSKAALRRAARSHPRAAAVLADLWGPLPIADGAATAILNVFAPRNGREFRRVLRPGGVLLVVTPAPDHLAELIAAHGLIHVDPDKAERVAVALCDHFHQIETRTLRRRLRLTAGEARTLIGMTPSAHHVAAEGAAAEGAEPQTVTAAVNLTIWG